jgi:hypothetical protein
MMSKQALHADGGEDRSMVVRRKQPAGTRRAGRQAADVVAREVKDILL